MTGLFISFEGVDGVGKTTQVKHLRKYAQSLGYDVIVTREPGGTALGKSLRKLLLHGVDGGADIAPRAEALIFAADRAQHVAEAIRPALERGAIVITDRYLDSSLAYQAGGRELTPAEIRTLSMWATGGLLPARTYLLDMNPEQSHERLTHRADRMESAGTGFQERTRNAFLDLASAEPGRFLVVDAAPSVDTVWRTIRADFDELLTRLPNNPADAGADDHGTVMAAAGGGDHDAGSVMTGRDEAEDDGGDRR